MRTQNEIKAEIAKLKALKPVGKYATHTQASINALVEELEDGWDITTDEFEALTEGVGELIIMAREWKCGADILTPSEGWGSLVV